MVVILMLLGLLFVSFVTWGWIGALIFIGLVLGIILLGLIVVWIGIVFFPDA